MLVSILYVNKDTFLGIIDLVFTGFELACIQCTSPIRRVSQNWDHSCLDGTLAPVPCAQPINESIPSFKTCVSALYTLGSKVKRGEQNHLNLF